MDIEQVKKLMLAMEESNITKVSIKEKTGFELQLERQVPSATMEVTSVMHPPSLAHGPYTMPRHHEFPHIHHVPHHHPASPVHSVQEEVGKKVEAEGRYVTSPMVGTFYTAPSPEHTAFVKVGDVVNEGSVVCIIEAMKVMNEVKAGVSGTIAEVYLENGHPVEFGTKLFRIV